MILCYNALILRIVVKIVGVQSRMTLAWNARVLSSAAAVGRLECQNFEILKSEI
jgi:hypothetical protein